MAQESVSIVEQDQEGDRAMSVVDGFVLEENRTSHPKKPPTFVPEEYGKSSKHSPVSDKAGEDSDALSEIRSCECCGVQRAASEFVAPSRRFCTITCCKRYSAARRYRSFGSKAGSRQKGQTVSKEQLSLRQRMAAYTPTSAGATTPTTGPSPNPVSPAAVTPMKGKRKKAVGHDIAPTSKKMLPPSPGESPYSHPQGLPMEMWSLDDVCAFLRDLGYETYQERFMEHLVDGKALQLIREEHMVKYLGLMLGPALKIQAQLEAIKRAEGFT